MAAVRCMPVLAVHVVDVVTVLDRGVSAAVAVSVVVGLGLDVRGDVVLVDVPLVDVVDVAVVKVVDVTIVLDTGVPAAVAVSVVVAIVGRMGGGHGMCSSVCSGSGPAGSRDSVMCAIASATMWAT